MANYYYYNSDNSLGTADTINAAKDEQSSWENLFIDTPYYDQYKQIVSKYSGGPSLTWYGDLTGSNSTNQYNHYMSFQSELQALQQKMYDEDYQSPISDVSRQRQAGINADLNGLTNSSAPATQPPLQPSISSPDILQGVHSVLSFALNTYSMIQGFKGASLSNESKDISNFKSLQDLASPHIIKNMASIFQKGSNGFSDWSDIIKITNPFKGSLRGSRRWASAFNAALSSGQFSSARSALEQLTGLEQGRMRYGSIVGSSHWSPDDAALYHFVGGMMDLQLAQMEHGFKSGISKSRYENDYYSNLSGSSMASHDLSIRESEESEKFIYRYRRDIYENLYNDYKKGSSLAGLLLIGSEAKFGRSFRLNFDKKWGNFKNWFNKNVWPNIEFQW